MDIEINSGFAVENSFFSSRGWHLDFANSFTAEACYRQLMEKSGWKLREVDKRPVTLEGAQIIFKTPKARKIEVLTETTKL